MARACALRATARPVSAADRTAIFTSSFMFRNTKFFIARKTIFIAKCRFRFNWPRSVVKSPCRRWKAKRNLKVPAGTQSGQMFKLRGKGIDQRQRARTGRFARAADRRSADAIERRATRKSFEEFADACGEENTPMRKSFFERARRSSSGMFEV